MSFSLGILFRADCLTPRSRDPPALHGPRGRDLRIRCCQPRAGLLASPAECLHSNLVFGCADFPPVPDPARALSAPRLVPPSTPLSFPEGALRPPAGAPDFFTAAVTSDPCPPSRVRAPLRQRRPCLAGAPASARGPSPSRCVTADRCLLQPESRGDGRPGSGSGGEAPRSALPPPGVGRLPSHRGPGWTQGSPGSPRPRPGQREDVLPRCSWRWLRKFAGPPASVQCPAGARGTHAGPPSFLAPSEDAGGDVWGWSPLGGVVRAAAGGGG